MKRPYRGEGAMAGNRNRNTAARGKLPKNQGSPKSERKAPYRGVRVVLAREPEVSGGTTTLTTRERQIRDDYDWCLQTQAIQEQYRGKVVAVHRRTIWGTARTPGAAVKAALQARGCPRPEELAVVFIEGSSHGIRV